MRFKVTFLFILFAILISMNLTAQSNNTVDVKIKQTGAHTLQVSLVPVITFTGANFSALNFSITIPNGVSIANTNLFFGTTANGQVGNVLTYSHAVSNTGQNWTAGVEVPLANFTFSGGVGLGSFTIAPPGDLYVEVNGLETQRTIINNANNILLPISLTSFDVTRHTSRSSKLRWTTSSEINSDFFGIERSIDGNDWENIANVRAAGTSNEEKVYSFIDEKLPLTRTKDQIFYYRLRLTDLDGEFKYSEIRGVNFNKQLSGIISVYPNPTADRLNVDISGLDAESGNISLLVFDMNGAQVMKRKINGNGIELINVDHLPASVYNVMVKQGESVYHQRIIKID